MLWCRMLASVHQYSVSTGLALKRPLFAQGASLNFPAIAGVYLAQPSFPECESGYAPLETIL
jgi:hypothetical protein